MKRNIIYILLTPGIPINKHALEGKVSWGIKVFMAAVLLLFTTSFIQAQNTWLPTNGGAWTTPGNWSLGTVPVTGDDVVIGEQTGSITAVPTISLNSLTINGSCTLISTGAKIITITGTFSVADGATLSLGTSTSTNLDLTLAAGSSGIIHGTGILNLNSTAGNGYLHCSGSLTIEAGALITGNQNFRLFPASTLVIGNPGGIAASGASGAILLTGTRIYQNANYVYNGSAPQITGNGLTSTLPVTLTINNSAGVTLSDSLDFGGLLNMVSGTLNISGYNVTVGSLAGSGNITGSANSLLISVGSDNTSTEYSGVITNGTATSIALTKNGTGTLTLDGANSYSGLTSIKKGTLKLGGAGDGINTPLGTAASGTIISATASLDLNGFTLGTAEALTIYGSGISGSGVLINSSATSAGYSGLITLGSASSIIANAGDINITNTGTISGNFALTLGGTGNGSIASIIGTGTGAINKNGTGTWTLSGINTFTGLVNINAGTLKLGAAGNSTSTPLGLTGGARTTISSGAALDLNGYTLGAAEPLTINGTGPSGGGALTNSSSTAVSYSGLITLGSTSSIVANAGDINITNAGTIGGAAYGLTLDGSGNGSISSVIGTKSGTLTKNGTGTWTLSGANTFTGAVTINAGILKLGAAGGATNTPLGTISSGTTVSSGAALDLNGFTLGTAESLTLSGTGISNGGALMNSSATAVIFNGAISLAGPGSIGATGNITCKGVISGGNTLTKVGSGTLILTASNTFSGGLNISAGTVQSGAVNTIPNYDLMLNGGILSTGATIGYSESVKKLALSDNSIIALGTGSHTLSFTNSSAIPWTSGKMLTITGWQGTPGSSGTNGKINFGASGLTSSQLAQIVFFIGGTYYNTIMLSTGEIVPSTVTLTISTGTISGSPFCAGSSVSVPFTITGTFISGNAFTAQLSDATGGWSSPVNIGTLNQTTAGTIFATIPVSTATGTGYRIRVISSSPSVNGTDNGSNITVTAVLSAVTLTPNTTQNICYNGTGTQINVSETGGGTMISRQWGKRSVSGGVITSIPGQTGIDYLPAGADLGAGTWYIVCTSTPSCGSAAVSNEVTVIVSSALSAVSISPTGEQDVCATGTGVQLTVTETNGGLITGRQWGKRFTSGGLITPISGQTGSTYIPSGTDFGTGTWYLVCTSTPSCGSPIVSNEVIITVTETGMWLGVSADWNDPSNWCGGVPTLSTDVTIPYPSPNMPDIYGSVTAACNNLTINASASLSVEPNAQLTVAHTLTNNGTLNLNSDASGIFSLLMSSYSGSGISNAQIFVTGGGAPYYKWHYVAVPVDGLSVNYFTSVNAYDLMAYNDSRVVTSDFNGWSWWDGYGGYPGIAAGGGFTTMAYGRGYNFYNGSDATVNLTGLPTLGTDLPTASLQYSGPTSNLAIYGLNLLGNSLTCSLNWDDVTFSGPTNQVVYFTSNDQWISYLKGAGGTNGATNFIPPLQGFIVKSDDHGATVDFSNAKVHSTQARYKKSLSVVADTAQEIVYPKVKLELNGASTSDETIVWFNQAATTGYDEKYDGVKLFSSAAASGQLYSILSGINYVIDGVPPPSDSITVPLGIQIAQSGNYSLLKKTLEELDNYNVYLIDKANGNFMVDLKNSDQYTFSSDAGTFTDRFVLKFVSVLTSTKTKALSELNGKFNIYGTKNYVNILPPDDFAGVSNGIVKIYDFTGRVVSQTNNVGLFSGSLVQIPFSGRPGIYIVEIISGISRQTGKIIVRQ